MGRLEAGNVVIIYDDRSEWARSVAYLILRELRRKARGERRWRRER